MKTVLDSFWETVEDIKAQSGPFEAIRSPFHPLNSMFHPLRSVFHPYRSAFHPLNSAMNSSRGKQRAEVLQQLLSMYVK